MFIYFMFNAFLIPTWNPSLFPVERIYNLTTMFITLIKRI